MILLNNKSANTDGSQETYFYNSKTPKALMVEGTFDGATVGMEVRMKNGSDWTPVPDSQFTAAGAPVIINGSGFDVRGALSGAGGSTDLTLKIV